MTLYRRIPEKPILRGEYVINGQIHNILNYINKNNEIIYHICYEVDNVEYILNEYFSMTKYKLSASQNMQYYLTIVLFHFITLPVWD